MIKSDILDIVIEDEINNSTITIETSKELMHKLYRIKEINKYENMQDYPAYIGLCNAIIDLVHKFYGSIECDYQELIQLVEQEQLDNNTNDAIALLDTLLAKGCSYKDAVEIVTEFYDKKGE